MLTRLIFINVTTDQLATVQIDLPDEARWCALRPPPDDPAAPIYTPIMPRAAGSWPVAVGPGRVIGIVARGNVQAPHVDPAILGMHITTATGKDPWPVPPLRVSPAFAQMATPMYTERIQRFLFSAEAELGVVK